MKDTAEEYLKLRRLKEAREREVNRASGALEALATRLAKEFDCRGAGELESKITIGEEELTTLEEEFKRELERVSREFDRPEEEG